MSTRIAIDLTPMRPGGENGGAKTLIWQLLNNFQALTPRFSFLLLTAEWNHDELAVFDRPGFRRLCILSDSGDEPVQSDGFSWRQELPHSIRRRLPVSLIRRLRPTVQWVRAKARSFKMPTLPAPTNGLTLVDQGVDVLFCPFTAVTYAEPGLAVISFVHDLQHRDFPQFFSPAEINGRERTFAGVVNRADRIICNSKFTRETLLANFESIEPEIVSVIPIAVHNRLAEVRETVNGSDLLEKIPRPFLYYPANFWPHKNHRMLLTAYNALLHQRPNLNLDLVFTGAPSAEEEQLISAAATMKLADRVHFAGFLNDEEIALLFQHCTALIYPSLYEGFGIPILEAFAFNKPVLCSAVTSLPEVAGDGAITFNPRKPDEIIQAIETLLDDPPTASRLVEAGKKRLADYEPAKMIAAYSGCFETVILGKVVEEDTFHGRYDDGWLGSDAAYYYQPYNTGRTLALTLFTPPWHPETAVLLSYTHPETGLEAQITLVRGETKTLEIPLMPEGGRLRLFFSPTFSPSEHEGTADTRQLSCMVKAWRVVE